jgi:hypothetical protein
MAKGTTATEGGGSSVAACAGEKEKAMHMAVTATAWIIEMQ